METTIVYWGNLGIMDIKMETTIMDDIGLGLVPPNPQIRTLAYS